MIDDARVAAVARDLAATVRFLAARGWAPATSGNFSTRVPTVPGAFAVSRSGVDKHAFTASDVMLVDADARVVAPEGARPSAEAALHAVIYRERPAVAAVLHVHTVASTVVSRRHARDGELVFEGLEIQKGLAGVATHESAVRLPIVPNSQDMDTLGRAFHAELSRDARLLGLLIAGHGLYAWGATLGEARRHVETFQFLLECRLAEER